MRKITKADMDKPIEPKMARDAVVAVRDIAAYLTVGEWCLIMAGVKKAVERMTQEENMVTKYEAGVLEYTPKCSIELLKQQKKHMGEYLHDLEVGAFVEGVEL